ncbi:MAG: hypothetical protein NT164_03240 [Verrucomicrobiae bacterium]|nr:hypothetical protein [Verrucomicrobiae bacterium]
MKKQLLASLLSLIFVAGLAPIAASATTDNSTSSYSGSSDCPLDKGPSAYKVLTKEECQRFCKAKAAAIAKDPSLAKPENKCKLCCAIVKADPSMKPICKKLRKNCRKMKKQCTDNCNKTSSTQSSSQDSASQQTADASSSSMNSAVTDQSAPASSAQQSSSSSATSAN